MAKKAISKKEAMKMAGEKASPYGNYLLVNNDKLNRAIFGNVGRGGQMEGGVGEKATPELVIAEYDKLGGLILTKGGEKVENGSFWDFIKKIPRETPKEIIAKNPNESDSIKVNTKNVGDDVPKKKRGQTEEE